MKRKRHKLDLNHRKKSKPIPVDINSLSESSQSSFTIPDFYEDVILNCVDCGKEFLFTAELQQNWYEVQKRYFWQRPIRCSEHHENWRDIRKKKFSMDRCLEQLKEGSDDQRVMKSCAESIVRYHQKTKKGDLLLAISLFKKLNDENELYLYCKEQLKK